jgi:hypothetical protein
MFDFRKPIFWLLMAFVAVVALGPYAYESLKADYPVVTGKIIGHSVKHKIATKRAVRACVELQYEYNGDSYTATDCGVAGRRFATSGEALDYLREHFPIGPASIRVPPDAPGNGELITEE